MEFYGIYPQNNGQVTFLVGQLSISMVMFNSYVNLPEGNHGKLTAVETQIMDHEFIHMLDILPNHDYRRKFGS